MIATKISSWIAQWSLVNPTIHGKCLLINTFLTSKIWYFTHAFPVSEKFLERISSILKSWLWPNTRAPILLSKLFGHKSTGGLGLLDFSEHSYCLFSKWIFESLNSTSVELSWQNAARVNFCKALGVDNTSYLTSLQKYFYEHPNARGPQSLPEFWRNVLKVIRKLDCKIIINRIDSSQGRRITYTISHLGSNITNAKTKNYSNCNKSRIF